jgi:hypothetical protein
VTASISPRDWKGVANLGPTQLKNIERSIRVYPLQVGVPSQAKPKTETEVVEPKRPSLLVPLAIAIVALIVISGGRGILQPSTELRRLPRTQLRMPRVFPSLLARSIAARILSRSSSREGDAYMAERGAGEFGKETLDEVEPRAVFRRERQGEAAFGLLGEPTTSVHTKCQAGDRPVRRWVDSQGLPRVP